MTFNTRLYIVKTTYVDDDYDTQVQTTLINGENLASAAQEADSFYGNNLVECTFTPLEEGPIIISSEMASKILNGDY